MTPEYEMRKIVESVPGGCWHKGTGMIPHGFNCRACDSCGDFAINPSPTDMNALVEYAEKLGTDYIGTGKQSGEYFAMLEFPKLQQGKYRHGSTGATRADALREALCQAVEEKDDVHG